jgi:hypothetical protein
MRWIFTLLLMLPTAAVARDALGVYGQWGAFRDDQPARCFAIAVPADRFAPAQPRWRPFASIATWPGSKVRNQFHIRMSKPRKPGSNPTLTIDGRRFTLVAAGPEAWAPDAATDTAIVTAMRAGRRMVATGRADDGSRIVEVYELSGAASAIDAATLACAR